jgi:hypothetical protein
MSDPVLRQLYIIHAQVELAIGLLEGAPAADLAPAGGGCAHPDGHRHDATTGGDGPARWICDVCDQIFDGPLP